MIFRYLTKFLIFDIGTYWYLALVLALVFALGIGILTVEHSSNWHVPLSSKKCNQKFFRAPCLTLSAICQASKDHPF